jgi:hypothetical protein
MTNWFV